MFQFRGKLFGEIKACLKPTAASKNLLLVGDNFPLYDSHISKSKNLLKYVSSNWERVYVVPGIVEVFGSGSPDLWTRNMDKFQEFIEPCKNVYMLNNSEIHDGDSLIVGSTFWCGMGVRPDFITNSNPKLIHMLDNWAKTDADFIGRQIKMATLQKKQIMIATYFSHQTCSPAVQQIMYSHLKDIPDVSGKWITGIELH